jgi:hypothetical protein
MVAKKSWNYWIEMIDGSIDEFKRYATLNHKIKTTIY